MSSLLFAHQLSKSFGAECLFSQLTLGIHDGDRLGIVGPNGSGKSTVLRILADMDTPDTGTVTRRQQLRLAYIPQHTSFSPDQTVLDVIEQHMAAHVSGHDHHAARLHEVLGTAGFTDVHAQASTLSGGWGKRLAIACGLAQHPDVMLLDEPTNHLDFEALSWLETLLTRAPWAWAVVTHDRAFLERVPNRIMEIHSRYPDGVFSVTGTYRTFVEERAALHSAQTQEAQALAGKVRRETAWLQRGPKARGTKAKYRVEAAHELQQQLRDTTARLTDRTAQFAFHGTGRKTRMLMEATNLTKRFDGTLIFENLDLALSPGTALGVLGHNGSGKSTLLRLLARQLSADEGETRYADNTQVVYFDQRREQLDPQATLRRTLSDTGHTVTYQGRTQHLAGWAKQFGFTPEQLDLPIELLSGGEQARALIARLLLTPADILLVDEPTNDLDIATREVLEESLHAFPGALVLVTHDRAMLTTLCNGFIGLDQQGAHGHFAEFEQWETWLRTRTREREPLTAGAGRSTTPKSDRPSKPTKLSYLEQREYDRIEQDIQDTEAQRDRCVAKTNDPAIAANHVQLMEAYEALKQAEHDVERLYARWMELDAKRHNIRNTLSSETDDEADSAPG